MAYTEQTGNSTSYNEDKKNITTWDAAWDVTGNVAVTFWDIELPVYAEQSGDTPTYTEE